MFLRFLLILTQLTSTFAMARETQVLSENRTEQAFVKITETSVDGVKDHDRINYFWCISKDSCQAIGRAQGYARTELLSKYASLKERGTLVGYVGAASGVAASYVVGYLMFAALVGRSSGGAVIIGLVGLTGGYFGWKYITGFGDKAEAVSSQVYQTESYIVPGSIEKFKSNLEGALAF